MRRSEKKFVWLFILFVFASDGKYTTSVQRLSSLSGIIFRNLHHCFGGKNTILKTRSQVFEWLFLEIFIQPKTWRRIFKSCWCFQISSSSFPTFAPSQNKKSPSRIYFLRRRFFQRPKTHVTHCTSIATYWFSNYHRVMTSKNAMSLMSLLQSSDISDMRKTSTLHGEMLIFSGLWCPCNECNGFYNHKRFYVNQGEL